jgi:uncharacterized membrane protein
MQTRLTFQQLLLAFFAFIGALICCRVYFSGSLLFIFLVWNIFLAWIPFAISYYLVKTGERKKWKEVLLFGTWLLFFPNALYIITDLIHLDIETPVPKWFDAILLFTSSIVGLMMAFISLFRAENFLASKINKKWLPICILLILFMGSFGVYLGRFLRWNSWDIIRNPLGLLSTIARRFLFPLDHLRTWGITLILTALFYLLYLAVKKLPSSVTTAPGRQTLESTDP